jgi:hypothetical protein
MEQWLLFSKKGGTAGLAIEALRKPTKRGFSCGTGDRRVYVARGLVQGFFPSFEAAADARDAARREVDLGAAKTAIKRSQGYKEAPS